MGWNLKINLDYVYREFRVNYGAKVQQMVGPPRVKQLAGVLQLELPLHGFVLVLTCKNQAQVNKIISAIIP